MDRKETPNFSSADSHEDDEFSELIQTLEQCMNWDGRRFYNYDDHWYPDKFLLPALSSQKHFKAENSDIVLASMPKGGTTWLKALAFCIANRHVYPIDQSPLLTSSPHELVPFLEYSSSYPRQENPDNDILSSCPRIFATHVPFKTLPESISESGCKIIYISRNPLDQFISYNQFLLENEIAKVEEAHDHQLDNAFNMLCQGIQSFGPIWDHMLGYWYAHLKNPHKVLFLKYENLKDDPTLYVKKIAEFLGCPFSFEEETQGLIGQISTLCSFEMLSSLEANKTGTGNFHGVPMKKSAYFRKGVVGDWVNYVTPSMAERFKKLIESKLNGSGLMLDI